MNLALITACPNGQVTSLLSSRLLRAAAERLGWSVCVECNEPQRPELRLSAEQIAGADLVLVISTQPLDLTRFAGKRLLQARPAEALADPAGFLQRAAAEAQPWQPAPTPGRC